MPHVLTETLREYCLVRSIELLPILVRAEQTNWHFILSSDESCFFYYTENPRIWLTQDVETSEMAGRLISTPKIMVTIFWHPSRVYVKTFLQIGTSFNSA
jgi:hypothetical protein